MKTCTEIVRHYRKLSDHHLDDLWSIIYTKGVKGGLLRDVLMFYFQHKAFSLPTQKSYDTLLVTFSAKGTSKKMKLVIFHILEEICSSLESNIVETLSFSSNGSATVELLNTVLVGGFIPLMDESAMEKLFSLLTGQVLTAEETGKLLLFLCEVGVKYQSVMPKNYLSRLNKVLVTWLQCTQSTPASSSQFFNRSDAKRSKSVAERSMSGDVFTVLTVANNFSKSQIMNVYTFSLLKMWLSQSVPNPGLQPLLEAARDYCTLLVEQCFRPVQKDYDSALQKAVLCECLDILNQIVRLDPNQGPQMLQVVKRIQSNVTEKFKSDHHDVSILVRVLDFLLNFGTVTGYNPQRFCTNFFKDIIYRSYSSELAAFDIVTFILDTHTKTSSLQQQQLVQKYFPNLLKLIACHPASLLEEFIDLIPIFMSPATTVELYHSLLDLPLLSATLCLHQASAVLQLDQTSGVNGPQWASMLESVRSPEIRPMFSFMLRTESGKGDTFDRLEKYMELLNGLTTFPLVVTCSDIVPLLLDSYFREIESSADAKILTILVPAMLERLKLLFNVPGYHDCISRSMLKYFKVIMNQCPKLVFLIQTELIEFVSALDNSQNFPQLYMHFIWVIGEYATPSCSQLCSHEILVKYYEALECVVYETLAVFVTEENETRFKLLNITGSSLTKLASRCQDLIPRVMLCLRKVGANMFTGLSTIDRPNKKIVYDRVEELVWLLKNPK